MQVTLAPDALRSHWQNYCAMADAKALCLAADTSDTDETNKELTSPTK